MLLASLSEPLGRILSGPESAQMSVITTNLASQELRIAATFIMSGCFPMVFEKKSLEAFKNLGIDLAGLKFSKVKKADCPVPGK